MRDKITYLGQSYPVDLDKGLVGTLTDEEIEKYSKGVNQRLNDESFGNNNLIFFNQNHAVIYRKSNILWRIEQTNICLQNYFVGNDLITNRLGAPEMQGVYFGEKTLKPFLVMEKLNLKKIGFLNVNEKRILFNDYYNGLEKIQGLGYNNISNDTSIRRNFEFDIIKKSGVFFDFDNWESEHFIPQLNEKGELIIQNPVRMFSRNPQRNKQEGELIR